MVTNGALTTFDNVNGGVVVALEPGCKGERAQCTEIGKQAWNLWIRDVKERSASTMDTLNAMRLQVKHDYFHGRFDTDLDFWEADEERAP